MSNDQRPPTFMDIDDVSAGATNRAAMLSLEAETIAGVKHRYSGYRSAEKTFIQFEAEEFFLELVCCVCMCVAGVGVAGEQKEILEFEALGAGYTFTNSWTRDRTPAPCPLI